MSTKNPPHAEPSRRTNRATSFSLAAALALFSATAGAQQQLQVAPTEKERGAEKTVTGGEVFHGLLEYRAKDAKLALVRPVFVSAEEANLPAGVSVVGVTANGEHRAYPLYVLKNHQVVNDRLGGVPIAASW